MDVTPLFRACVKTVKTRYKTLGLGPTVKNDVDQNRLMMNKVKSDFYIKCKEMVTCITKLRDFLLDHRKTYINTNNLMSDSPSMSDVHRDQIDSEAQNIIRQCSQNIREFHLQVRKQQNSSQLLEYQEAVVSMLQDYLKSVCKIYSEQRAIRIKKIIDLQKLSKLQTQDKNEPKSLSGNATLQVNSPGQSKSQLEIESDGRKTNEAYPLPKDDEILSPEEIQMFEQENQKLYEEFTSLTAEIKQIEGKVIEISKLQQVFAEKVLEQEKDVELLSDNVMGTTENIKDANEELREAMKKNANFRVFILFFLLVLSFSLLFLDWYNP